MLKSAVASVTRGFERSTSDTGLRPSSRRLKPLRNGSLPSFAILQYLRWLPESCNGVGGIVGFNFMSEKDPVRAIGPIVIDPTMQAHGIGRRLMGAVLERARGARSIRLLQETYNMQSLSLYASLGFDARELFVVLEGIPKSPQPDPAWQIRPLTEADLQGCESLHRKRPPLSAHKRVARCAGDRNTRRGCQTRAAVRLLAAPTNWLANHGVAATDEDMQALMMERRGLRSSRYHSCCPFGVVHCYDGV